MPMTRTLVLASLLLLSAAPACADPGYYVVTAYDNEGQRSVDFRYWTVRLRGSPVFAWPEVGFGYGVTSRWTTGVLASWIGSSQMATRLSTWNWQNEFLLTQGQYPFDLAVYLNYIANHDRAEGDAIEVGPVFQTELGRATQLNLNLFFERHFHTAAPGPTTAKYQWQVKYRASRAWQFGVQGFGELGRWDTWSPSDQQSHRAGPAIFGTLPMGDGKSLQVQAAYLVGSIYGQHGSMFSLRAHYTF